MRFHGLDLDAEGSVLLSRRVANDEPELLTFIGAVLALADGSQVTWAIDMTGANWRCCSPSCATTARRSSTCLATW
ncbi:hypothetical protein SVTN_00845 [Streptomyces vietnamensis]|uniref:Uncharacterized protein n=1 Tax=Streptomyces vietnamensis TaxID=362257 RepID=A0A0B5I0W2_9ACTN|nr:hypothetical protein SVTN_00845 [Streptomyces vietnamensis]